MSSSRRQYPFHLIEPKWQKIWDDQQAFRAFNPGDDIPAAHPFAQRHKISGKVSAAQLPKKFYILDMFPYPSGAGLHVGHPEGYTATDILARYKRAQGFNVLHPMGWDAFGLPAEQYAVKTGQHPRKTTEENIATFKRQIKSLGFSYDWSREIATTDPDYFKWTQWIFLKLYNSWFNPETNKAEPIETLKYPIGLRRPASSNKVDLESFEYNRQTYRDSQRLAFVTEAPVWWCEELGTVLANEEVVDGKSEVGGFPVIRKPMRQWMLRITRYAERLLQDLDTIDWTNSLKEMQRNWIGRSEGAYVRFCLEGYTETTEKSQKSSDPDSDIIDFEEIDQFIRSSNERKEIWVFTTRPDTLFGATYIVLAPEHPLAEEITLGGIVPVNEPANWKSLPFKSTYMASTFGHGINEYKLATIRKSELERTALAKEKTGQFTGAYAINPVNGARIPIFIADYVLSSYGTGAIMAVPAHDERDYEFALKFGLEKPQVVLPSTTDVTRAKEYLTEMNKVRRGSIITDWSFDKDSTINGATCVTNAFCDEGIAINSANSEISLDGLPTAEAKKKIIDWLQGKGLGNRTINYKLRDWLFSRQRYWGEPFPIVWKKDANGLHHEPLLESALPVLPPELTDYKPTATGEPPLARAKDWVNLGDGSQRETNTMPQWAGSCWYYLRYLDAKNPHAFVGEDSEKYWMGDKSAGVDLYVGGTEHAVLHLLYARFWHKVLFDLKFISTPEPFFKLVNQGLILGEMEYYAFRETPVPSGEWVSAEDVIDIKEVAQSLIGKDKTTGKEVIANKVKDTEIEKIGPHFYLKLSYSIPKIRLETRLTKMSKSRGNVINPDDILAEYGADAFRLYEMFMGPLEMVKPWSTKGVEGVYRFLGRVWRLFVDAQSETEFEQAETTTAPEKQGELLNSIHLDSAIKDVTATPAQMKTLHACIKKVTEDMEGLRFNTAISALMVFVNEAMTWEAKPVSVLRDFLILLHPFAPHLAEELWARLPNSENLAYSVWPPFDQGFLVEATIDISFQREGKTKEVITVPTNCDRASLEKIALSDEKIQSYLEDRSIEKVILKEGKFVNVITKSVASEAEEAIKKFIEKRYNQTPTKPIQSDAGYDFYIPQNHTYVEVKASGSKAESSSYIPLSANQYAAAQKAEKNHEHYELHYLSGFSPATGSSEYHYIISGEMVMELAKEGQKGWLIPISVKLDQFKTE